MSEIIGYKCFQQNLQNKYGKQFEVGKEYRKEGKLKFGKNGHGFHFCINLEDTFRYFNTSRLAICTKVIGSGDFIKVSNYAYQSGDMYVTEKIKITEILDRTQILQYALSCSPKSLENLLALYSFTKEELEILKTHCQTDNIYLKSLENIERFQTGDITTFKRSKDYLQHENKR